MQFVKRIIIIIIIITVRRERWIIFSNPTVFVGPTNYRYHSISRSPSKNQDLFLGRGGSDCKDIYLFPDKERPWAPSFLQGVSLLNFCDRWLHPLRGNCNYERKEMIHTGDDSTFQSGMTKNRKTPFVKFLINKNTLLPSIAALLLEGLEWPFYFMLTILFEKVIVGPNHPSSPPKQETQLFRPAPSTCFTTGNDPFFISILPHLSFCCHQGSYEGRWLTIAASGECLMDYVHGI